MASQTLEKIQISRIQELSLNVSSASGQNTPVKHLRNLSLNSPQRRQSPSSKVVQSEPKCRQRPRFQEESSPSRWVHIVWRTHWSNPEVEIRKKMQPYLGPL